jgi:uroporphyrinogen decarboxylase
MNSRERILATIRHKEPDRIPVDLGATPSSGISAIAYTNLKKHLEVKEGETRIYDVVQQLAQPEDFLLNRLNIDVLDIGRMFNHRAEDWYSIRMADSQEGFYPVWFKPSKSDDGGWQAKSKDGSVIAKMPKGATFFDQTFFPYMDGYPEDFRNLKKAMDKVLWQAMVHSPWDHAHLPDFWQQLRDRTLRLREKSDHALMIVCGCNLFEWGTFLRRIDNFLMDIVLEQGKVEALLEELMQIHLQTLENVCAAVGDIVDILRFGDDLGMDNGPFMDPGIYQKFFKPRHRRLCDYVKKNSQMHTFLHSCGSIYKLMPDLIEAGFEILNPVQTNCADMDPRRLKREFGRDIVFWGGGADTRHVLNRASPDEIKAHVRKRMEIFSPGGGFVFNTIHNILPEVPPENIVAMFEAVEEFNGG